jgi:aminotransferase EvaB
VSAIPFNDLRRAVGADDEILLAIQRVTLSGWYLLGQETTAFENELADYLGVNHVIGVANGTDGLELALAGLGANSGEQVVMAANAGSYGAIAARRRNLTPRFADVDDGDLLLTADSVEQALTPQTRVVIVTHLYGKMAPVAAICDLCHARGVRVLEDCAQAAGARIDGRLAGSVADAAVFSFYPTKNLAGVGDAGAVVTSDEQVAQRVRRLRQYGWATKYSIEEDGGRNSRLDEIQAAVLRVRLGRLDDGNRRRRAIAQRYVEALSGSSVNMVSQGGEDYVAHLAVVRSANRDQLRAELDRQGIATAIHYPIPDHRQKVFGSTHVSLPVTESAAEQVLSVPCFPELQAREVDAICAALSTAASSLRLSAGSLR